jgi:transcriptional regulator with XRE-family HTH domain
MGVAFDTFGQRLRFERIRLGMSQTAFADKGGVGKHAQIHYEKGVRFPDVRYLTAVAAAGVDVNFLIYGFRVFDRSAETAASVIAVGVERVVPGLDASHHDPASATVRLEELPPTLPAGQRVVGDGLKDRLDLLLIAGCAYAVRGLTVGFGGIKFIHERALLGAGERVAQGLGLKAIDAALFFSKVQQRALHRYLLRLKPDQPIEQIRDQLLRRSGIDIRLLEQGLDVLCSVRRTLGEAYGSTQRRKDRRHEV